MDDLTAKFEYWKELPLKKLSKLYKASCLINFYGAVITTLLAASACFGLVTMWENNLYAALFAMKFLIWCPLAVLFVVCRNLVGRIILFILTGIGAVLVLYGLFAIVRLGWRKYIAQIVLCMIMYVLFYSTFWIALQKELFLRKLRLNHYGIKLVYKSIKQGKEFSFDDLQKVQTAKRYFTYNKIMLCIAIVLSITCMGLGLLRANGILHI